MTSLYLSHTPPQYLEHSLYPAGVCACWLCYCLWTKALKLGKESKHSKRHKKRKRNSVKIWTGRFCCQRRGLVYGHEGWLPPGDPALQLREGCGVIGQSCQFVCFFKWFIYPMYWDFYKFSNVEDGQAKMMLSFKKI